MNRENDAEKQDESSDTVEESTVVSRSADSNSNGDYWSASPYFLEILIPVISSFLLLRRRDLFGRLLLNLDKTCFSALCPSLSKREHLLKWAQRGIMPSWIPCPMNISLTLDDVWKDGSLLCTLINSAIPGACPNPHRHRNKPPTHGQALVYKYFGLAPIFTSEDFDQDLTGNLEFMFFMYLTQLRTNISQFSSIDPSNLKYTSSYIARGMGLVTGEQYKKCVFYLYPNSSENDTGVLVTIKGPYHAYGCITLPPFYILKTSPGRNRKKEIVYLEEDIKKLKVVKTQSQKHLFRSITSAIIPLLRNAQRSPITSKIRIQANKEPDRIKLTYVPQHPGVHIMCIVTDGCHLQGSPFNVSVTESNVEEIQKETVVTKTELVCDLITEKSKSLNEAGWINSIKSPLSSNRYFNKSTCGQIEPHLFEKYNWINYQKFCKKFELFRSSFDERQEFSLDSSDDEELFTNNKVKFLNRNSKAFERFTHTIQKVIKMVKNEETHNDNNNTIEGTKMTKAICDRACTLNDQEQENVNKKIRYFEDKDATKRLEGIAVIKRSSVVLERYPMKEFTLSAPKRAKKQQKETQQVLVKSINKRNFVASHFKRIPSNPDIVQYNIEIKQLPAIDNNISEDINKIFEIEDSKEKRKFKFNSAEDARIDKAENNSFFTTTGTVFEDDGSTTAVRSKKTITSESNNTSSNFSAECEVDKTKNAITEQSVTNEISENKNMFTNEKIIKNITDKNGIPREEFNGKTSDARGIFEGDQFNFNKSQQHSNAGENFKGIDIWQNRADASKIHEKDREINSVKMKIFTYDNSVNTQMENKLKIDHQRKYNHNIITKSPHFSLVKNRKEIFDNKYDEKQNTHSIEYKNNSQKLDTHENVSVCVSGENVADNFLVHPSLSKTPTELEENYLGIKNSALIQNKDVEKEMEDGRRTEPKKEDPIVTPTTTRIIKESTCSVIGGITKTGYPKQVQSPIITEEKLPYNADYKNGSTVITETSQKAVSDYNDYGSEMLSSNWNEAIPNPAVDTKLEEKQINSSKTNLDLLLKRVDNFLVTTEQEEMYEKDNEAILPQEPSVASNQAKLNQRLDHLLDKVDNLIDDIELEEKSTRQLETLKTDDHKKTINLDNNIEFLMERINKIIDATEAEEKRISEQIIATKDTKDNDFIVKESKETSKKDKGSHQETVITIDENVLPEEQNTPTSSTDVEVNNKPDNLEINDLRRPTSVLRMIQRFESPSLTPPENEEHFRGNTENRNTPKSISYLEKRDKFIAMEMMPEKVPNTQLVGQQISLQRTTSQDQEFNENNDLIVSISKKSTVNSEPSTPSKTVLNKKEFLSTESQSDALYSEPPDDEPICEFLDLTQERSPTSTYNENYSENDNILPGNRNNSKTSTIYIVTERQQTEIRKNVYTHSFSSPTKEKICEIYDQPLRDGQYAANHLAMECASEEEKEMRNVGKKPVETHQPETFSSIIKNCHNNDEEQFPFPDVSGFLKENNRQHPHIDYPKDFSVSRRVSQNESLQSLLAQNNMYVTSQIHRSHPNIYFGENPKRKRAHKPWRKLKSFDANLLTASSSESRNDNSTKFFQSGDIITEKLPNEGTIEGKRIRQIIKSSGNQQAERRSGKAVSNYQINQEGLHDEKPPNSQLSLGHPDPDAFPSVKDLRSKFETTEKPNRNPKIKEKTRSLDPDKHSCLDSSEVNSTPVKHFSSLINSTRPTNDDNRENNIIKPLKHAKNIFSSIQDNANKDQPELTLTRREEGIKEQEHPQPQVLKSTSRHRFNGGCKQGTTSPPQYSFIKTPEATNSIRSAKTTHQVVQHDKEKTPERGDDASLNVKTEELDEIVDFKNIMKNQFTKARNFFKELETNCFKKCKRSGRGIKKKRKNSNGSGSLPKVWEKFPLRNIYKDVLGEKRGSFKGTANRVEVANSMASVPVRNKYFDPDNAETLPSLDIFHQRKKSNVRKSLKSIFLVDY